MAMFKTRHALIHVETEVFDMCRLDHCSLVAYSKTPPKRNRAQNRNHPDHISWNASIRIKAQRRGYASSRWWLIFLLQTMPNINKETSKSPERWYYLVCLKLILNESAHLSSLTGFKLSIEIKSQVSPTVQGYTQFEQTVVASSEQSPNDLIIAAFIVGYLVLMIIGIVRFSYDWEIKNIFYSMKSRERFISRRSAIHW